MIAAACAVTALSGFDAAAAAPMSLREAFLSIHPGDMRLNGTPPAARYEIDEGGDFIFDRSAPRALLKFDDDPEIWVLQASPGPHGDVIYKNDVGEEMLRATKLGGMTVYTARRPTGSAAALQGACSPLRLLPLGPSAFFQHFYQASVRASRAGQHLVAFETMQDADPGSEALLADAAMVASEAVVALAGRPEGRVFLSRIDKVVFAQGARPQVLLRGDTILVTVVVNQGVAGRPSSARIVQAAGPLQKAGLR